MQKRARGRPRKFKSRVQTNAEYCRTYRKRLKRSVHFRSDKHTWETPPENFDPLHAEFGFTVDVCALPHNAKLPRYYTPEQDGLQQDWSGEIVWCNPPYDNVAQWVRKAYEASQAGALVVCLIPSRTGTRCWHTYVHPYAEIRYLDKRIRFVGAENVAPFDSAVVIFRPVAPVAELDQPLIERLRWGKWTLAELQWLRSTVTTPEVIQAIDAKIASQSTLARNWRIHRCAG